MVAVSASSGTHALELIGELFPKPGQNVGIFFKIKGPLLFFYLKNTELQRS
jgi:hypothetical protein